MSNSRCHGGVTWHIRTLFPFPKPCVCVATMWRIRPPCDASGPWAWEFDSPGLRQWLKVPQWVLSMNGDLAFSSWRPILHIKEYSSLELTNPKQTSLVHFEETFCNGELFYAFYQYTYTDYQYTYLCSWNTCFEFFKNRQHKTRPINCLCDVEAFIHCNAAKKIACHLVKNFTQQSSVAIFANMAFALLLPCDVILIQVIYLSLVNVNNSFYCKLQIKANLTFRYSWGGVERNRPM